MVQPFLQQESARSSARLLRRTCLVWESCLLTGSLLRTFRAADCWRVALAHALIKTVDGWEVLKVTKAGLSMWYCGGGAVVKSVPAIQPELFGVGV